MISSLKFHSSDQVCVLIKVDILHPCDVAEDLAVGYGYNNIIPEMPPVNTVGKQQYLNKMTELLRHEMASSGYKECLNFALCNLKDNTTNINLPEDLPQVTIENAKTIDFQAGRTNLISGLLKTLKANKKNKLPLELFEVSDVILKTDNEVGAKNERHLAALRTNLKSSELSVKESLTIAHPRSPRLHHGQTESAEPRDQRLLHQERHQSDLLQRLAGRHLLQRSSDRSRLLVTKHMGILEPSILKRMDWVYPISAIEINIEPVVDDFLKY